MSKTIFKKTYSKACPAAISPAHNNFPSILRDPWVLAAESVCKYSSHESFTSIPNKVKGLTVYSSSGERHLTESTAHDRMWWESERGSLQATLLPNSSISRSHPENCLAKVSFYLCLPKVTELSQSLPFSTSHYFSTSVLPLRLLFISSTSLLLLLLLLLLHISFLVSFKCPTWYCKSCMNCEHMRWCPPQFLAWVSHVCLNSFQSHLEFVKVDSSSTWIARNDSSFCDEHELDNSLARNKQFATLQPVHTVDRTNSNHSEAKWARCVIAACLDQWIDQWNGFCSA
jgi:hypothetical protein